MADKVLIIDNDKDRFKLFEESLTKLGKQTERYDGKESVESTVTTTIYSAVIINLTTLSDISTIEYVKDLTKYTSDVIITGTENEMDLVSYALDSGVDGFISLPTSEKVLRMTLKTIFKQSCKKIEKYSQCLLTVFDIIATPAVITDTNGRILNVNSRALKEFSRTKENSIGELFGGFIGCNKRKLNSTYFHDGCQGCNLCIYGKEAAENDKITEGKIHKYRYENNGKEEDKTLKVSYAPVLYEGIKCVFINFEEVTIRQKSSEIITCCLEKINSGNYNSQDSQKQIENFAKSVQNVYEDLKDTDSEYMTLIDNMLSGYIVLEKNAYGELFIKSVNKRLCEIFGGDQDEYIGTNFSELLVDYDPRLTSAINEVLSTGKNKRLEYQSKLFNKYLKINIFMVNSKYISLIIGDNTFSRLSNERLKKMVKLSDMRNYQFELFMDGSKDGAWSYDYSTKELYLSPQFKRLLGYEPEELKIKTPEEIFEVIADKNDKDIFYKKLRKFALEGANNFEEEIRVKKKSGEEMWIMVRATVRMDVNDGAPEMLGGVITDTTQRKQYEEKLHTSNEELKKAVDTKNKFISIISHDLRNQFNAITGLSEILMKRLQSISEERCSQMALVINQSSKSAYKLLNDLLTWARSQMNNIEFNPQELNLNEITEEALSEIRVQAQKKHICLMNNTNEDDIIYADKQMFQTIVRNIATNSIKFTNPDGLVMVSGKDQGDFYEVSIKDNGIGMSIETRSKLMSPSQTKTTQGTAGEKGSGMGLLICKEFADKHGGNIKVESTEGKGTEFIISFPKKH